MTIKTTAVELRRPAQHRHRVALRWLTIGFTLLLALNLRAETPLEYDSWRAVSANAAYAEIEQLQKQSDLLPWRDEANYPIAGAPTDTSIWYTRQIAVEKPLTAFLITHFAHIEHLDVYLIRDHDIIGRWQLGNAFDFSARPLPTVDWHIPLHFDAAGGYQLVMRISNPRMVPVSLFEIVPMETYLARGSASEPWHFAILGVLAIMALYNLVVWLLTRDASFGTYVVMALVGFSALLADFGYGFKWLWPHATAWNQVSGETLEYVFFLCAGLFGIRFMNLANTARIAYAWLRALLVVVATVLMLFLAMREGEHRDIAYLLLQWGYVSILLLMLSLWIISGQQWLRHKDANARNYFYAWSVLIAGMTYWVLAYLHVFEFSRLAIDIAVAGYALETILLSFALAARINASRERERLVAAENQAKTAFLAKMSHEIRTPLNGMLGMSELLDRHIADNTGRYYNHVIQSSGKALVDIISDVLDYSRLQSQVAPLKPQDEDLTALVGEVMQLFSLQADDKDIDLFANIDADVPSRIEVDGARLRQILIHLLANAMKFTQKGEISVHITRDAEKPQWLRFCVKDTGTGIDASLQPLLFRSFTQLADNLESRQGSTGIGLALCYELATLMGGTMGVDSQRGHGASFWFTILLREEKPNPMRARPQGTTGRRVLFAVSNPNYARLCVMATQRFGLHADCTYSGNDAMEHIRYAAQHNKPYDILCIDWKLADCDCLSLLKKIQQDDVGTKPRTLLLSNARDLPHYQDLRFRFGIHQVIRKPNLVSDLLVPIRMLIGTVHRDVHSSDDAELQPGKRALRCLVAEDNRVNQVVIRKFLDRLGHSYTLVENGLSAIDAVQTPEPYDIVLMDCEMPECDGLEATSRIRELEHRGVIRRQTILALTAHADQESLKRCIQSGMDGYITKPVSVETLHTALQSYCP